MKINFARKPILEVEIYDNDHKCSEKIQITLDIAELMKATYEFHGICLNNTFCFWMNPACSTIDMKWTTVENFGKTSTHLNKPIYNINHYQPVPTNYHNTLNELRKNAKHVQ